MREVVSACAVKIRAFLRQTLRIVEFDQLQPAANGIELGNDAFADGDGAFSRDLDVAVGRLEHDRAVGAQNDIAAGGDELTLPVDLE